MADSILRNFGDKVAGFFGYTRDESIRDKIYEGRTAPTASPAQQGEPKPASSPVQAGPSVDFGDLKNYTSENVEGLSPADLIKLPETLSGTTAPSGSSKIQAGIDASMKDGSFAVKKTKYSATQSLVEDIKRRENPTNKGLVSSPGGEKLFMPFKSMEGRGSDKANSEMEIGYGTKILKSWLSDDKSKWPVVDGVPVNVKNGITMQQAQSMARNSLDISYRAAKSKVAGWDEATEMQKKYWIDLAYNGGASVFERNPNAMKALKNGYGIEGMVRTLDYIKAGGKVTRGLLNRRLSMYNEAALEHAGVPVVTEYVFGPDIKVKFGSKFLTKGMSPTLSKKINDAGGWFVVSHGGTETKTRKVGENFRFEE